MRIMTFWQSLAQTIYGDSTRPMRLILALVEIFFVTYLLHESHTHQFSAMLGVLPVYTWVAMMLIHSIFLLRGLTGRYSGLSWFVEGWCGMIMWWIVAITNWTSQGVPGPTLACALAMTIIWVNYPGNRTPLDEDEVSNG